MNDEIMKAIEETAQNAVQNQEQMEKEAYINKVAVDIAESVRSALYYAPKVLTPAMQSQMGAWATQNRTRFSLQIEQVVRILLRKELLEK